MKQRIESGLTLLKFGTLAFAILYFAPRIFAEIVYTVLKLWSFFKWLIA